MLPCFHYSFLKGVPKKQQTKKKVERKKNRGATFSLWNIQGNIYI